MGKIDTYTKPYLSKPNRFAEFFNVTFYRGNIVLKPCELWALKGSYPSLSTRGGEKQRDILMEWKNKARYGLELENDSDITEAEQVLQYDTCDYAQQMQEIVNKHKEKGDYQNYRNKKNRMFQNDKLLPVVTKTLYLGEGRWKGSKRLSDLCDKEMVQELGPEFHDYPIDVIESEYINPGLFQTDLREFFEALQSRRDKTRLKELFESERYQNLDTDAKLAIIANVDTGEGKLIKKVEEGESMCQALRELLSDEREEGIAEGREEGIQEGKHIGEIRALVSLVKDNIITKEMAASRVNMSVDEFMTHMKK